MIRFYHFDQRSEKWRTYRKGKWTGSTAIDLLRGKKTPPEDKGTFDNKYMQRGRILEPLAIEAYEKSIDELDAVNHYGFITNSKYKHAGYSPDGVDADTLVEVKCLNVERHAKLRDSIPAEYMAQIQFGLLISELYDAVLVAYNPDAEEPLIVLPIKPDPAIQANLIAKLKATEPKRKPSQMRAAKAYLKNNPDRVREANRKRYLKSRQLG